MTCMTAIEPFCGRAASPPCEYGVRRCPLLNECGIPGAQEVHPHDPFIPQGID